MKKNKQKITYILSLLFIALGDTVQAAAMDNWDKVPSKVTDCVEAQPAELSGNKSDFINVDPESENEHDNIDSELIIVHHVFDEEMQEKWFKAAKEGNSKLLATLYTKCQINVDHRNKALLLSAEKGHLACVEYLIQQGADIHAIDKQENTALLLSAEKGHLACVKYLVQQGADINTSNTAGLTALSLSAKNGHVDCVKYLVKQGANIHEKNKIHYMELLLNPDQRCVDCARFILGPSIDANAKDDKSEPTVDLGDQEEQQDDDENCVIM